jgi:hypothetical protein
VNDLALAGWEAGISKVANRDHFVARTVLRRWYDPDTGLMYAYRKPSGDAFPCSPESVCAEVGGDLNPDYFKDPNVLGQFRGIFESQWNTAVAAIEKGHPTSEHKLIIAGCFPVLWCFIISRGQF